MTTTHDLRVITNERTVLRVTVIDETLYTFNEYIALRRYSYYPVNDLREEFHAFLPSFASGTWFTLEAWDAWWIRFIQTLDARDLADTHRDALR